MDNVQKELRCRTLRCRHLRGYYCCSVCCRRESCLDVCYNTPEKCGLAKEIGKPYVVSEEQWKRQQDTSGFVLADCIVREG